MKKKMSFVFLAFLVGILVSILPCQAQAEEPVASGYCGDDLTWTLNESGTLTISGTGDMYDFVIANDMSWYDQRYDIKQIVIESGVTSIGRHAFYYCENVTSVLVQGEITRVGAFAFYECNKLVEIDLPDSNMEIGKMAFYNCDSLEHINMGANCKSIGDQAFYFCPYLSDYQLPEGIVSIGERSLCYTTVSNITIPETTTTIGSQAFRDMSNLISLTVDEKNPNYCAEDNILYNKDKTELIVCVATKAGQIVVPDTVTKISDYAFRSCDALTNIQIPDAITEIGQGVFMWCKKLEEFSIPDSVTSIGEGAFYNCKTLTEIEIPDKVSTIGDYAFMYCTELAEVSFGENVSSIGKSAFQECGKIQQLIFPDSVTQLGEGCFSFCYGISSIKIGTGMTNIEADAFLSCSGLTSIDIDEKNPVYGSGDGVLYDKKLSEIIYCPRNKSGIYTVPDDITSIRKGAFEDCNKLTEVVISQNVKTIGEGAFRSCKELTKVTLPEKIQAIESYAFSECAKLECITIPESIKTLERGTFSGCSSLNTVSLPETMTEIGRSAFSFCTSLSSIVIPEGVHTLGLGVFEGCTSLVDITLPDTLLNVAVDTFYKTGVYNDESNWKDGFLYIGPCLASGKTKNNIESYSVKEGTTCIAQSVFSGCTALTSITLPDSIQSIGDGAFYKCIVLNNIVLPDNLKCIGDGAFKQCSNLDSVSIPDGVTRLGANAFCDCTSLKQVNIPKGIDKIEMATFELCKNLTEITVPVNVKEIDISAFYSCSNMERIYILDPKCVITENDITTISWNTTICGYENSTAYLYAKKWNRTFEPIVCQHVYDEGTITSTGVKIYTCQICQNTKTEIIVSPDPEPTPDPDPEPTPEPDPEPTPEPGTVTIPESDKKLANYITASNITKTVSLKKQSFVIRATRKGNGKLSYRSNNKYITVNSAGRVIIAKKYIGKATITISVKETDTYQGASKKITITVLPPKTSITKLSNKKGSKIIVTWKKNSLVTGYQIQYSTDSKFRKASKIVTVKKNNTAVNTIHKLKKNKKYYVRIRTYKKVSGKTYYSGWSKIKNIKILR